MSVEEKMQKVKEPDVEQRIAELETQLAFQEDHVRKLNDVLIDQQKRLDAVESAIRHYEKRLGEIQQGFGNEDGASVENGVPPHY